MCVCFYRNQVLFNKANFLIVHGSRCSLAASSASLDFGQTSAKSSAVIAIKKRILKILN